MVFRQAERLHWNPGAEDDRAPLFEGPVDELSLPANPRRRKRLLKKSEIRSQPEKVMPRLIVDSWRVRPSGPHPHVPRHHSHTRNLPERPLSSIVGGMLRHRLL